MAADRNDATRTDTFPVQVDWGRSRHVDSCLPMSTNVALKKKIWGLSAFACKRIVKVFHGLGRNANRTDYGVTATLIFKKAVAKTLAPRVQ